MTLRLVAVTFDVPDAPVAASFWASLLGRDVVDHDGGLLLPGDPTQVGLRFVGDPSPTPDGNRDIHLHVTSEGAASQQEVIDTALGLGATRHDAGQLPDERHVVLADPSGNAFCVIEPDNGYLAGTGLLGEVACDGSREIGAFWSDVLDWPLVWDQDDETAIQSPAGGTKVAWGGRPVTPLIGRVRRRFDIAAPSTDVESEVHRLLQLGASRRESGSLDVTLTDPGGNEFRLAIEHDDGRGA